MATCKDCVYEPRCYSRIAYGMDTDDFTGELLTDIEKRCNHFKDKADVVPVVRCKDCTEWDEDECECSHWYGFKENDFCSYGERKDK